MLALLLLPWQAMAQGANLGLEKAQQIGLPVGTGGTTSITDGIVKLIQLFLSFMGLLLVIIIMYAGFTWMTSMGNEEKTEKAKKTLTGAIIGIILILLSYSIVNFVIQNMTAILGGKISTP